MTAILNKKITAKIDEYLDGQGIKRTSDFITDDGTDNTIYSASGLSYSSDYERYIIDYDTQGGVLVVYRHDISCSTEIPYEE